MNILSDDTGWILPPRCASRWTAGLLWKYGLVRFAEHHLLMDTPVKKIVMNVRDPIDRLGSYFRLLQSRDNIPEHVRQMTIEDYVENLYTGEFEPYFTHVVVQVHPDSTTVPYPPPLYRYVDELESYWDRTPDHFVRVENIEEDCAAAGYPVRDHRFILPDHEKEIELDFTYDDMKNNQRMVNIILGIYERDLEYVYGD